MDLKLAMYSTYNSDSTFVSISAKKFLSYRMISLVVHKIVDKVLQRHGKF